MLDNLLPFLTVAILLTISPGPDILYVLVQSLSNGIRAGLLTALGLVSGILLHTSLVAFGVSAALKESDIVFLIIRIFGALYLFYLAYRIWKSDSRILFNTRAVRKDRDLHLFRRGFVMNVLNPKVTVFFLAFFPGFLWDTSVNTVYQFFVLGALFMLQAFIIFGMVALLAGKVATYLHKYKNAGVIFKWLQIGVFIGIGIFIFL